jgi:sister-chromatid-cohesion protein PDS5
VIDEDEEGVQTRLRASIEKLVAGFADRQKAAEDLRAFAQLNEPRLYKLLRTCFDTQTDLKTLVKATVSCCVSPAL